jgi:hypothetical protein
MSTLHVRFRRNVLGHRAGTDDWVEATPYVEMLLRVGALTRLDEPEDFILADHAFVDIGDWYLDESQAEEILLPTGETIAVEELLDRLDIFEDDGGPDGPR